MHARYLADAVTSTLVLVDEDALLVVATDGPHATALQGQRFDRRGSLCEALDTGRAVALDDLSEVDLPIQPLVAIGTYGKDRLRLRA